MPPEGELSPNPAKLVSVFFVSDCVPKANSCEQADGDNPPMASSQHVSQEVSVNGKQYDC